MPKNRKAEGSKLPRVTSQTTNYKLPSNGIIFSIHVLIPQEPELSLFMNYFNVLNNAYSISSRRPHNAS